MRPLPLGGCAMGDTSSLMLAWNLASWSKLTCQGLGSPLLLEEEDKDFQLGSRKRSWQTTWRQDLRGHQRARWLLSLSLTSVANPLWLGDWTFVSLWPKYLTEALWGRKVYFGLWLQGISVQHRCCRVALIYGNGDMRLWPLTTRWTPK